MVQIAPYAPQYVPRFRDYQPEYLQRLALLVNIDSGTGQVEGINRIIEYLSGWLQELEFAVELRPTNEFGWNLIGRRRGRGKRRLLLVGHVDTVYPRGAASARPFLIDGSQAYGPGVIDMKSGVLLGLYALRVLIEEGYEDYGELVVLFNNDEEVGSPESAPLLRELAQEVDVALVLEPSSEVHLLTGGRKGTERYLLEVTGMAAHSSEPYKGRSAVLELAHKIVAIHNLQTLFPRITFNVTKLSSSEVYNIIPDRAECYISVRAHRQEGLDHVAVALEQIAAGCSVPGTQAQLTRMRGRRPYITTSDLKHLFELAQEEGQALGVTMKLEKKGGVSDANVLMEAGVPALDGLGPVGEGLHNLEREYLDLDTLALRGALLTGLLRRICDESLSG